MAEDHSEKTAEAGAAQTARRSGRSDAPRARIIAHLANQNPHAALRLLDRISCPDDESPGLSLLRVKALIQARRFQAATATLDRAQRKGASEINVLRLRRDILAGLNDPDGLDTVLERLCELQPDAVKPHLDCARHFLRRSVLDPARKHALDALALQPDSMRAHRLRCEIAAEAGDIGAFEAAMQNAMRDAAGNIVSYRLHLTLGSLPLPQRTRLESALKMRWPEYEPLVPRPSKLQGPGPETRTRAIVVDDGTDMLCTEPGMNGHTFVFFAGFADRVMVEMEVMDAFTAAMGAGGIYLRDPSRTLYLNGLREGTETGSGQLDRLRTALASMGTRRLTIVGASAGGFGAIRYGLELRAERIIAFGAPTSILAEDLNRFGDDRARLFLHRMHMDFPRHALTLRPYLAQPPRAANGAPIRLELHYSGENPVDRAHAEHLADQPNVALCPVPGVADHTVIVNLIQQGRMAAILAGDTCSTAAPVT